MTPRGERIALLAVLLLAAGLRLPALHRIPNGLIPDEALSAYDAFSIVETGRDAHGERLPLFPLSSARLHSLNTYLVVPFVALRGLDEWSARLPAALAGIATVALLCALLRAPFGPVAALGGATLLAVSPWHVLLSRTGYDWNLLPAMATLSAWLLARGLARGAPLWPAGLAAGLSLYTYAPIRLFLPLLLASVLMSHAREARAQWRRALPALLVAAALAAPVVAMTLRPEGRQRLASIAADDGGPVASGFAARFARSFSPGFLLSPAGAPELHRLGSTGLLYPFEAALAVVGIGACLARRDRRALLPVLAFAVAPLAAAIHRDAPDPVLTGAMLPWLQALAGIGASAALAGAARLPKPLRVAAVATAVAWAGTSVSRMGADLFRDFPVYAAGPWGYGARDAIAALQAHRQGHDDVVVATDEKLLFSVILFYSRYEPGRRQAELADLPGRQERTRVGDYRIGTLDPARLPGRHLVWTTAAHAARLAGAIPIAEVKLPDGRPRYALLSVAVRAAAP